MILVFYQRDCSHSYKRCIRCTCKNAHLEIVESHITYFLGGGGATKWEGGGGVLFYPYKMGGGLKKVVAVLKGGRAKGGGGDAQKTSIHYPQGQIHRGIIRRNLHCCH